MRSLRERLNASERATENLVRDLSAMAAQRKHMQGELYQAQSLAAQQSFQLADLSLAIREGKVQWTQEKQDLQRNAEVILEELFVGLEEILKL